MANGTLRLTTHRNNIVRVKNEVDMANIRAINWHRFHALNRADAEERRRLFIEYINTANQLLVDGQKLEDGGDEAAAQAMYTQSAEMYRYVLNQLKILSPIPMKNFRISAVAPPGTRRNHFNFAVQRARETGGDAAADHVIAAAGAASAELARATSNRIPALRNAYTRLAAAESNPNITKNALNKARHNATTAFRELYGSATNRREPLRVAYTTARPYVREFLAKRDEEIRKKSAEEAQHPRPLTPLGGHAMETGDDMGGAAENNFHVNEEVAPRPRSPAFPAEPPGLPAFPAGPAGIGFLKRRSDLAAHAVPSAILGLPPTAPRETSFPFGPAGAGAAAAPLATSVGSLRLSGVPPRPPPKRGGGKTRRVHRGGMYTLAQKRAILDDLILMDNKLFHDRHHPKFKTVRDGLKTLSKHSALFSTTVPEALEHMRHSRAGVQNNDILEAYDEVIRELRGH